jgi:diguanylate cyclase (GGDEF)-like protein/PAS domain S-box-containing protein
MSAQRLPVNNSLAAAEDAPVAAAQAGIGNCRKGGPSSEDLLMFFEQSSDLLCITSFEGYFLHCNQRWEELLGYRADELLDSHFLDFVHPDDQTVAQMGNLHLNLQKGEITRFENRFRAHNGKYHWLQWSARSDPEKQLIFASARDITEAKEAQGLFQVVVEAAPAGLMIANRYGLITLVNQQIEKQFGYRREELLDMPVERLIPDRYRSAHGGFFNHFIEAPASRAMGAGRDLFALRKDGTEFPVEVALNPFHSGGNQFVLCTVVDITGRRKHQSELKTRVEELQRNRVEMDTLSRMSSLLQHAVLPEEVYQIATAFSSRLFENAQVGVFSLLSGGNYLHLTTSWGGYQGPESIRPDDCWALRRSRTHHSSAITVPTCPHASSSEARYRICIPMSAHGQLIGLLTIGAALPDGDEAIGPLDRLGRSVADHMALALTNLGLRRQLEDLSMRDALTDLFNRRYLEETIAREMERADRKEGHLGILMIDADHFKKFNDTHGHLAGDEALRLIARTFQAHTRPSDVACRYGGEEFIILLPDCGRVEGAARAECMRAAVCEQSNGRVSISVGVAEYPAHGKDWPALVLAADEALYNAKSRGRNCVMIAADPEQRNGKPLARAAAGVPPQWQAGPARKEAIPHGEASA